MVAKKNNLSETVPPIFQIYFIIFGSLILSVSLWFRASSFRTLDKEPPLKTVDIATIREFGGNPSEILVGLQIDQFKKFDVVNNDFLVSGIVWFLFYPGIVSLQTLEKFDFLRGTIDYRSSPKETIIGDKLLVQYNVRVSFTSYLQYSEFPLDDHRIYLTLVNNFINPSDLMFESTERELTVTADVHTFGWENIETKARSGFIRADLDPYDTTKKREFPAVTFALDYKRVGIRYIITIFLPLLLMFYIALFGLSLPTDRAMPVVSGALTAILAYRFVIETISPHTGYFMLTDSVFVLILSVSVFVFFTVVANTYKKGIPLYYKKLISALLHLLVIIGLLYLFK
ncbi:MAG: hypothetical protein Q8Q25_03330 [bacterium]|nr:hypothetical protein [bacterium]